MFKRALASIGIGAATVDTILQSEFLYPGKKFNAEIILQGGDVHQQISGLELALVTRVKTSSDDDEQYFTNHIIEKWQLAADFALSAGEEKTIEFEATLHPETPITEICAGYHHTQVWLITGLNIDMALDAADRDVLQVLPNEAVKTCMQAMEKLGFRLMRADVEKGYLSTEHFYSASGCYQELEYHPVSKGLFGIEEVEISFVLEPHRTHVLIEIERALRGDGYTELAIEHDEVNLAHICDKLERLLS